MRLHYEVHQVVLLEDPNLDCNNRTALHAIAWFCDCDLNRLSLVSLDKPRIDSSESYVVYQSAQRHQFQNKVQVVIYAAGLSTF